MTGASYATDEVQFLESVLEAATAEAAARNLQLPIALMRRRLHAAARWGERDPQRLKATVLGDALHDALKSPPTRTLTLGQGLALLASPARWAKPVHAHSPR